MSGPRAKLSLVGLLLGLAAAAPAFAAGHGEIGLYGGLFLPGGQHELYDPVEAEHRRLSPAPAFGLRFGWFPWEVLGAELEADLAPSSAQDAGGALLSGWRAHAVLALPEVAKRPTPFLAFGGGNVAVLSDDGAVGRDLDRAAHWGAGLRVRLSQKLRMRGDFRHILSAHHEVVKKPGSHFEVLVGVGLDLRKKVQPDFDGDGIADWLDKCPEVVGDMDDGCLGASIRFWVEDPDGRMVEGATVTMDGVPLGTTDDLGALTVSGERPDRTVIVRAEFREGGYLPSDVTYLELVRDLQETPLKLDFIRRDVRTVARTPEGGPVDARVSFIGPEPVRPVQLGSLGQAVHSLRPGTWTVLFEAEGAATQRRVLELPPGVGEVDMVVAEMPGARVEITMEEVVVLEKIYFDFDSADIRRDSVVLIEEIAANLLAHPEILQVEIAGHTDAVASETYNMDLSQRRVDTVVSELVARGVARHRMQPVGYGESSPISTNRTEQGREKNRRVEFVILERE
jgi:outer membrane protein OmpA-like peptidoglycan-associated protein